MESWLISTRMIIILYCVMRYTSGNMDNAPQVVLYLLVHISAFMVSYIFTGNTVRRCSFIVSLLVLYFSAVHIQPLFILLAAMDFISLAATFTDFWGIWLAVLAGPVFYCPSELFPEYIVTGLMVFLVYLLATKHFELVSSKKRDFERLREKNEELSTRLMAGNEYEAQVRTLSEIEARNSVAQKIHDRVGHTLAGSIIQLEAASLIMEQNSEKAGEMIRSVTHNLKRGMEDIRSTLRSIKPVPEQLGINRLKLICDEFSMKHSIKTTLSFKGRMDVVTHLQWKIIIDNVKEALTNALKYSNATLIEIKLEVMNRLVKAEVKDNGKGALSIQKGMGLTGMEERTEGVGGKLILDGSDGFSVIALLPSEGEKHANKGIDR